MSERELKVVGIRLVEEQSWYSKKALSSPEAVVELLCEKLSGYDREVFCILNMSTKQQIINFNIVGMGTLNSALVHPRETFKAAILSNADSIMLIHNHLSGICEPSEGDIAATKVLAECGRLLKIEVIDHIIIGDSQNFYSFQKEGLLQPKRRVDIVA